MMQSVQPYNTAVAICCQDDLSFAGSRASVTGIHVFT